MPLERLNRKRLELEWAIHASWPRVFARAIATCSLACLSCFAQGSLPECFVEITVYDEAGQRIDSFRITAVRHWKEDPGIWWEEPAPEGIRLAQGRGLYFRRELLEPPSPISILIETQPQLRGGWMRAVLSACRQQESMALPVAEDWGRGRGRLIGCKFDDRWWVRNESLLGATMPHQDAVEPSTGEFSVLAMMWNRQLVVVGRGRDPVKAFAVNIPLGIREPPLGDFDVSDSCPEAGR